MKTIKGIIFDMDGVLVDTEQFYYDRRQKFMDSLGVSIDHLAPSFFIGGNMKNVWKEILKEDYDNWDIEDIQKKYADFKANNPLPYKELLIDKVVDLLSYLKNNNYKLALASSSTKNDINKMLNDNNLKDYFDVILSGEDFKETKPNPEIYETAVAKLGLDKKDLLIIEDSEKGIEAGVNAGVEVWAIEDTRFGMDQSKADMIVKNLEEVYTKLCK